MPDHAKRCALVLGGGGILGAAWEIGVLTALEKRLGSKAFRERFGLLVGSSAGAFVASLLAQGVAPSTLFELLANDAAKPLFAPSDVYRVDWWRLARGGLSVAGGMLRAAAGPLRHGRLPPSLDIFQAGLQQLPAGFLRIEPLARRLAYLYGERGFADTFAGSHTPLLVPALDIDRGQRVLFGARSAHAKRRFPLLPDAAPEDPPLSLAVTASAAIPRLFGAVEIAGSRYVDGDIGGAMHVDAALATGADRVLAISPVVASCLPETDDSCGCRLVSGSGLGVLLDQCSRIDQESAVSHAVDAARLRWPEARIVLVRPRRDMMSAEAAMSWEGHTHVMHAARDGLDQLDPTLLAAIDSLLTSPCESGASKATHLPVG